MFRADKGTTSACYGKCATYWPPVLTSGKPVAGPGIKASLLGTTKRKDGKLQVTYKKHPLYFFLLDKKPGQTTGEGSKNFGAGWYALTPTEKDCSHRFSENSFKLFRLPMPSPWNGFGVAGSKRHRKKHHT